MKTKSLRNLRWPIIVFIPLLVATFAFWQRVEPNMVPEQKNNTVSSLSWFCPMLSQSKPLFLTNSTSKNETARVTLYSNLFEETSTPYLSGVFEVKIDKNSSEQISPYHLLKEVLVRQQRFGDLERVNLLLESSSVFMSALVEFSVDGLVADTDVCINRVSSEWIIPFGSTGRDACYFLLIFNPFQNTAIVDIKLSTDDGIRNPYDGLVIPSTSTLVVNVSEKVVRRQHFSTHLTTRVGKVAVSKYQTFTGKSLNISRNCPEAKHPFPTEPGSDFSRLWGEAILVAASLPAKSWYFPVGTNPLVQSSYTIYNPSEEMQAEVEVTFISEAGVPAMKKFAVPPAHRVSLAISSANAAGGHHPLSELPPVEMRPDFEMPNLLHWAIFSSTSDIVVQKVQTRLRTPDGLLEEMGLYVSSTKGNIYKHQLRFNDLEVADVAIINPASDTIAKVRVSGSSEVEIPPLGRLLLMLDKSKTADIEQVVSSSPVLIRPVS